MFSRFAKSTPATETTPVSIADTPKAINPKTEEPVTMTKNIPKVEASNSTSTSPTILTPVFTPTIEAADNFGRLCNRLHRVGDLDPALIASLGAKGKQAKPAKTLMSEACSTMENNVEATINEVEELKAKLAVMAGQMSGLQTIVDVLFEEKIKVEEAGPKDEKAADNDATAVVTTAANATTNTNATTPKGKQADLFDRYLTPTSLAGAFVVSFLVGCVPYVGALGALLFLVVIFLAIYMAVSKAKEAIFGKN